MLVAIPLNWYLKQIGKYLQRAGPTEQSNEHVDEQSVKDNGRSRKKQKQEKESLGNPPSRLDSFVVFLSNILRAPD